MKSNTYRFAYLSVFLMLEIVMFLVPFLGFIPLGLINATTLHIPVILAAVLLGPKEGAFIGFVFGLLSLLKNTFAPSLTSFLFSPFISGNIMSLVIVLAPRILIGAISGVLYRRLKDKCNNNLALGIASFFGSFVNTALVMGMAFLFFKDAYAGALNVAVEAVGALVMTTVMTNGLAEAGVAVVFGIVLGRIGQKELKHL